MALVLITGGAGFIGSHLVTALLRRGDTVRVLDNLSSGSLENLCLALDEVCTDVASPASRRLELITGDVRDAATLRKAMRGVELVFHHAAYGAPVRSITHFVEANAINIVGTLHLLQAAHAEGARRVVYASSCAVYGDTDRLSFSEADPVAPVSPYAASKLSGEAYCSAFSLAFRLETVSLRYFNVYGPRQSHRAPHALVPALLTAMLRGERPTVPGDGRQTRDFVYVDDAVGATLSAAFGPVPPRSAVNVASGRTCSFLGLVGLLNEILGMDLAPHFGAPEPGEPRHSVGSTEYARAVLDYTPRVSLREGIERTARWARERLRHDNSLLSPVPSTP